MRQVYTVWSIANKYSFIQQFSFYGIVICKSKNNNYKKRRYLPNVTYPHTQTNLDNIATAAYWQDQSIPTAFKKFEALGNNTGYKNVYVSFFADNPTSNQLYYFWGRNNSVLVNAWDGGTTAQPVRCIRSDVTIGY